MKAVAKLVAILGLMAGFSVSAVAGEAVIDTGKGGLRVVLDIDMDGPFDFAKNPGPRIVGKKSGSRLVIGEAMFNGNIEPTVVLVDQLLVVDRKQTLAGDEPYTVESLANEMLKTNGFTLDRATKIDGPNIDIPGATVVTYKAFGHAIFEKEKKDDKRFMIVQAVSYPGNSKGYSIMATVVEKNVAAFDADPIKYEKLAKGGFMPIFRGLRVSQN